MRGIYPALGKDPIGSSVFTVAPSELTFLLHDCIRCFYMKVVRGERRLSTPMPKVFTVLDRCQREYLNGRPTSAIHPDLAPGVVSTAELRVFSKPIFIPGTDVSLQFRGAIDAVIRFDDRTFGLVDLKTTNPKDGHVALYWLQLNAYALALESPALLRSSLEPIVQLGLLCFEPLSLEEIKGDRVAVITKPTWIEVPRDDEAFLSFLEPIARILSDREPPPPDPDCRWCKS